MAQELLTFFERVWTKLVFVTSTRGFESRLCTFETIHGVSWLKASNESEVPISPDFDPIAGKPSASSFELELRTHVQIMQQCK